jgi:hypothetical protein
MEQSTNKALKEWASVIKAMASGQQVVLFRKGGIIEKNRQFEVESPEFFLYPTYIHQSVEQLQPAYAHWIAETETERPTEQSQVKITHFAKVSKVLEAKGIERLRELTDVFIWTPEYVEKTWAWKPQKPAYLLFLRVYALETPYVIEERAEYGGCISWIDLHESLAVKGLTPVMDDETFNAKCQEIEQHLANTMVCVS